MTAEPRLPQLLRWVFVSVDRKGFVRWRWEARNHRGEAVLKSFQQFDTYTECVEDAKRAGYIAPELRKP
jgi:hypothetical protein